MQHPTRGLLGPNEFIPVAEETGLIRELGCGICGRLAGKSANGGQVQLPIRHLTISVNLSAKQFLQPNLVEDIRQLLLELALPPEALEAGDHGKYG